MANCLVSTISALADIIKDEIQYKSIRDLTNKKETLMTQISRVGLKLGSKARDYDALRTPVRSVFESEPETEPEPICTTLTQQDFPIGKNTSVNTTIPNKNFLGSCFEIGPGSYASGQAEFVFENENGITINGNLTIRENTKVIIRTKLPLVGGRTTTILLNGNLIMENNSELIITSYGSLTLEGSSTSNESTLNNSKITVSDCGILSFANLDLQNTSCTLDFKCGVGIIQLSIKNSKNSKLIIGDSSYGAVKDSKGPIPSFVDELACGSTSC
jgi:hypothetical protein